MKNKEYGPVANLLFNVVLPVFILKNLGKFLGEHGEVYALLIAISLPLGFGIAEFARTKKTNWISVLGFVNTLLTGTFALVQLEGRWFVLKETTFPLLIGLFVFLSSYRERVFIKDLFFNEKVFMIDKIQNALKEKKSEEQFEHHLRKSTKLISASFLLSAALNFGVAMYVFTPIESGISETAKREILNTQIADMTYLSYIFIVVPCIIVMFAVLYYMISGIKKYTGLELKEIMNEA